MIIGGLLGGTTGAFLGHGMDKNKRQEQAAQSARDQYISQLLSDFSPEKLGQQREAAMEKGYGEAEKLFGVNRGQLASQTQANLGTLQQRAAQGLTPEEAAAMRGEVKGRGRELASGAARAGLKGPALASAQQNMMRQAAMDKALLASQTRRQSEGQLRQYTGAIQQATMGQAYGMASLSANEQALRAQLGTAGAPQMLPQKGVLSGLLGGLIG